MKIKIIKGDAWYRHRVGETFEVEEYSENLWDVVNQKSPEEDGGIWKVDCEVVTDTQWLTKEEALKLAIDGAKVVNEHSGHPMTYVDFNGINFVYHNGCSGNKQDISLVTGRWKLWTPPSPKFANGTFVVDECGDYMRVIESEFVNGKHMYYLASGNGCTKDNCVSLWESDITEA